MKKWIMLLTKERPLATIVKSFLNDEIFILI